MNTRNTISAILNTAGDGLWSRAKCAVNVTAISVPYLNEERTFGELRVHFNEVLWPVDQLGLIYTDSQWIRELQVMLAGMGYAVDDVDYSEQGMQGTDYVSCDVGENFISSYLRSQL